MADEMNGTVNNPSAEKLWENLDPESTEIYKFIQHVNQKYGKSLAKYDDLYWWSIDSTAEFWGEVWEYTGVKGSKYSRVRHPLH
jgi:acetoacetyl-CoA synthetase